MEKGKIWILGGSISQMVSFPERTKKRKKRTSWKRWTFALTSILFTGDPIPIHQSLLTFHSILRYSQNPASFKLSKSKSSMEIMKDQIAPPNVFNTLTRKRTSWVISFCFFHRMRTKLFSSISFHFKEAWEIQKGERKHLLWLRHRPLHHLLFLL